MAPQRTTKLTRSPHRAADVWQLRPASGNRQLRYGLLVAKGPGGGAPLEPIPLLVADRVEIDTSWNC